MKLTVKKSAIESAANLLSRVINAKCALPILGDILCEVCDKKMTMTASDAEVTLTTTIGLEEMEGDGRFCVDASRLKDALSQLDEQPLTILATTESDMRFILKHQSGETFFPIENADEFPLPMKADYNETLDDMSGAWLRDALKRSLWATANDDLRPVMNGVNFALTEGFLDIVASDGHVMVKSHYSVIDKVKLNRIGSFIMPKKVAKILSDVLDPADILNIEWNERECHIHLMAVAGTLEITFRIIEGKYPNYNSIIPSYQPLTAIVPRAFMANSIRKVIPFTTDNNGSKLLSMAFKKDELTLTGEACDFTVGANDKFVVSYDGAPITIGVSGSRLLTIMSKLSGQQLVFGMNDPSRAIVIEPVEQPEECEVLMLVMPMMLND